MTVADNLVPVECGQHKLIIDDYQTVQWRNRDFQTDGQTSDMWKNTRII